MLQEISPGRPVGWMWAALFAAVPAWTAADDTAAGPAALEPAPSAVEPVLEATRRSVRSTAEWLARGVDSWFGSKPFEQGGKVTDGRLSLFLLEREQQSTHLSVRFNARFWLPNLQDRAFLFLGRDDAREAVTDKPDALSRQQESLRQNAAEPSFFAGLGLRLHESLQARIGFQGGLKPYAHLRYGHSWQVGDADQVDFRETVFWALSDHFGSTTALSYEHLHSPTLVLRGLASTTVTQEARQFAWSASLGAYRSFGRQRLLSLEFLGSGQQGVGVPVTDVGLQARWEQPVHREWLLGQVLVGHFWPRPDAASPRTQAWAVGAGLKLMF